MSKLILTDEKSIVETLEFKKVGIIEIKQELQKNVEFSKNLTITDFEDEKQFELVKSTKNGYVKTRNTLKRAFKSKRDINTEENRQILEVEREVIAVIEEEEKRLDDLIEKAEKLKIRKQNQDKLQDRRDVLLKYEFEASDNDLLEMKDKEFDIFLSSKKEIYLIKKENELKEQQEKILKEKQNRLTERKIEISKYSDFMIGELAFNLTIETNEEDFVKLKNGLIEAKNKYDIKKQLEEADKIKKAAQEAKIKAEQKAEKEKKDLEEKQKADIEKIKKNQEEKELAEKINNTINDIGGFDDINKLEEFLKSIPLEIKAASQIGIAFDDKYKQLRIKEQTKRQEKDKLEKAKKYKDFLEKNKGNYDGFFDKDGERVLYKIVDKFNISV